ncbi:non-ribosomal peptide synthetase [Saccharomonospora cyanea]|uniref:Amino acid adenylation enzyme/thioester reductase family protein n=1 Tax=Saccharomonospora cyanea NA-134 TaxID=882082 RepID=H5XCU5_9PSEU|nr:non-ribosomal peptide synthetase [Saccharomonospora cyanea]EHR62339.1 amino acid adenylation enzyme/thioester reductase family protein [Saccharomonospora cyanea NA-134]
MDPAETITAAFARQVAARPDTVAVSADGTELTYAELDVRSDRLAGYLHGLGVSAEDAVGVALPRSADLVVALLAVLKAGAAYLALDPQQPEERRTLVLKDADVDVVITPELLAGVPEHGHAPPEPPASGERTAYIAYTSGSTGIPKGVCVPQRAVLRLVFDQDFLDIRPDDVFLQLAPVAFDASTLELWGPLLNGARLVVTPPGDVSPRDLAALVRDSGVTVLWLTAGLFHTVVEAGADALRGLRCLLAGGDVLSAAHVDRALRALPDTRLVNGYGPTENTTFTACHVIAEPVGDASVPIGLPVNGTTVHLLDDTLRPVPDGQVGELYAGGLGVATGYRNDPALTARKFLPDPFSDLPGARLYRTGDLARRRPDGVLEFHGRVDDQVKIRGFRVEIGEIEAALRRHPEVRDVAVVAQQPDGDRVLAAFYVSELTMTGAELREHLAPIVPRYMMPSVFCHVDALPLTPNGKVDRERLSATTLPDRPDLSTDYRAPSTEDETWLAELWADLMQVREVGVDDDFFELGGHSLMATRITVEIAERYGRTIPAVAFYENPTIAELARLLAEGSDDA